MDSINTKALDMISSDNQPNRATTSDEDFTEAHYRQLLRAARVFYRFATYDAIPWGSRFILWRHDLDYSINRAVALAGIESEEGVTATYFVNPCSEYYNPFEPSQAKLLKHILTLGHRLGLHFDAALHDIRDEEQLHKKVAQEGRWLKDAFGVSPAVFSFHNPGAKHLQCDAYSYGGLISCYSRRFKEEIPYCSDSNGYWRFRRLHDVLTEARYPCLQVLTHPGWWQAQPMPPRQRIFRCAYGRAEATMRGYDEGLRAHGRLNNVGVMDNLCILKNSQPKNFVLCDYLWNCGEFQALLLILWRVHQQQITYICNIHFRAVWGVRLQEVSSFFRSAGLTYDRYILFIKVFQVPLSQVVLIDEADYIKLKTILRLLINGNQSIAPVCLEEHCINLCQIISRLADWGLKNSVSCDGLAEFDLNLLTNAMTDEFDLNTAHCDKVYGIQTFRNKHWEQFKRDWMALASQDNAF
jgi:hypothetical protein